MNADALKGIVVPWGLAGRSRYLMLDIGTSQLGKLGTNYFEGALAVSRSNN